MSVIPLAWSVAAVVEDDRQRDQVRSPHSGNRVELDPLELALAFLGRAPQGVAVVMILDLFGFLRRLPEEQIWADRRPEDRDDHGDRLRIHPGLGNDQAR